MIDSRSMDKVQLLLFFVGGLLLSRALLVVHWPERIVHLLFGRRHVTERRLIAYLLSLSAALSLLIPNALTVLTLLPILEALRDSYPDAASRRRAATAVGLSVIYGANIGGLGSVTATPANAILVAFAELKALPGREIFHFASWLAWGLPLALLLTLAAIVVLWTTLGFRRITARQLEVPQRPDPSLRQRQRIVMILTVAYFLGATLLSSALLLAPERAAWWMGAAALCTLLLAAGLLLWPLASAGGELRPLLLPRECITGLPLRGFMLVGVAVAIAGVLYVLRFHVAFAAWIAAWLPEQVAPWLALLVVALVTSFSTELLSNTAVQLALFAVLDQLAPSVGLSLRHGALVASLSSTCAFMSPIATGVNGLAFGGLRGVSLYRMLLAGLVMNVVAAAVISAWAGWVVP